MNLRRGFKKITLVVSVVTAIVCGVFASVIPVDKYQAAKSRVWFETARMPIKRPTEQELKEFEKWRQENISPDIKCEFYEVDTGPGFEQSLDDVRKVLSAEQKNKFWRALSIPGLVAIIVLHSLAGAAAGYLVTWLFVWFGGLAVHKLIRWVVLGFRDDTG